MKTNLIFVGDIDAEEATTFVGEKNLIILQCGDVEAIRQMLQTGKAEFTVFGEDA